MAKLFASLTMTASTLRGNGQLPAALEGSVGASGLLITYRIEMERVEYVRGSAEGRGGWLGCSWWPPWVLTCKLDRRRRRRRRRNTRLPCFYGPRRGSPRPMATDAA